MLAELPLLVRYTVTADDAAYAIPFRVYRPEDVAVSYSTNGLTETALTLGKDYSVQILATGAELTLAPGWAGAVVPAGAVLAIASAVPATQEADLSNTATVDTAALETQLDREVQMIQQLEGGLARAVKLPAASTGTPEELLEDIFAAADSASDSATSAAASANAAADSARSAAGSAAIATEEREAACVCAQESQAARDVALAQTEAVNILMETELGKVNAIVAANRTDQQAAVTAARAWAEKAPDLPVCYDEEGKPRYSALHWADRAQKLAINPDGETVAVDTEGILRALGGNLLLNSETWITASGAWVAPVTGWYDLSLFGGGSSGYASTSGKHVNSMSSGAMKSALLRLEAGQEVAVTVGAGGGAPGDNASPNPGGPTSFAEVSTAGESGLYGALSPGGMPTGIAIYYAYGAGIGGGYPAQPGANMTQAERNAACNARGHYGGSGAAVVASNNLYGVGAGAQGSVRVRWHDPAKAAGTAPALFSARRMAARTAAQPAVINLYDPETGQGSVWREEDAPAKLAEGLITEAAWQEICAANAAEAYAAWLADPATEAERFGLLRAARDAKLAEHDVQVVQLQRQARAGADVADALAAWDAYAVALCDLPAQNGAPWDGGGELTPWPEAPALGKVQGEA